MNKYNFITRFDYVKGNELLTGSFSVLFILTRDDNKYICKRVNRTKYNENEWKFPREIGTENVISFVDICEEDGYVYMISPYNGEKDLFCYFDTESRWDETKILKYLHKMALCIKDVHSRNIVHLDIKAENFIVKQEDPLKLQLIDFGFARRCDPSKQNKLRRYVGTPVYIAPELFQFHNYSLKSDIYSLGVLVIFILYPELLDTHDTYDAKRYYIKHLVKVKLKKHYSKEFYNLVQKMIDIETTKRYSIDDVIRETSKLLVK